MNPIQGHPSAHLISLCLVQSSFKGRLLRDLQIWQLLQLLSKAYRLSTGLLQSLIEVVALVVPHKRSLG